MEAAFIIIGLLAAFVAFDLLAARFGVDSRYESSDRHAPTSGLSA